MASAHGIRAIGSLQPAGAPDAMMPFLIIIESISFFARGISISVRLFANMLSGHILVKIVLSFLLVIAFSTLQSGITGIMQFLIVILIVGATSAIICLETVVALLQSYVFSILTCSYIQDSVTIH